MMRKIWMLGALASLAAVLWGQDLKLGSTVQDFSLQDLDGKSVQLSSLKGDVTVLMFIATKCPISNDYNGRMNAVHADYASKGVKFIAVNANSTEPATEVREHASANGFPFKVYKDPNNVVADRFGAQVTPEVFVLDKAGTIRYHGFIDDSRDPANIKYQGLRGALDAVMAGKGIDRAETKAFGCTIKRVRPS